jgi:TIR domain
MTQTKFRSGVFVSYSREDREWVDRLQTHLAPYLRGETFYVWDDAKIPAGTNWKTEIDTALAQARVAVLLVSPEFLASEYVSKVELPAILGRAGADLAVLWIPIRPSAYEVTPLKHYQAAHDPSQPLAGLPRPKQDEALVAISRKIAAAESMAEAIPSKLKNASQLLGPLTLDVQSRTGRQAEAESRTDSLRLSVRFPKALSSKPDRKIVRHLELPGVPSAYEVMQIDWQVNSLQLIEHEDEYTGDGRLARDALRHYIKKLEEERANSVQGLWRRGSSTEQIDKQLAEARKMLRGMDELSADAIDYLDKQFKDFLII